MALSPIDFFSNALDRLTNAQTDRVSPGAGIDARPEDTSQSDWITTTLQQAKLDEEERKRKEAEAAAREAEAQRAQEELMQQQRASQNTQQAQNKNYVESASNGGGLFDPEQLGAHYRSRLQQSGQEIANPSITDKEIGSTILGNIAQYRTQEANALGYTPNQYDEAMQSYAIADRTYKSQSPYYTGLQTANIPGIENMSREEAQKKWEELYAPTDASYDKNLKANAMYGDKFAYDTIILGKQYQTGWDKLAQIAPSTLATEALQKAGQTRLIIPGTDIKSGQLEDTPIIGPAYEHAVAPVIGGLLPWIVGGPLLGLTDIAMTTPAVYKQGGLPAVALHAAAGIAGAVGFGPVENQLAQQLIKAGVPGLVEEGTAHGGAVVLSRALINGGFVGGTTAGFAKLNGEPIDWGNLAIQTAIFAGIPIVSAPKDSAQLIPKQIKTIVNKFPEARDGLGAYATSKYVFGRSEHESILIGAAAAASRLGQRLGLIGGEKAPQRAGVVREDAPLDPRVAELMGVSGLPRTAEYTLETRLAEIDKQLASNEFYNWLKDPVVSEKRTALLNERSMLRNASVGSAETTMESVGRNDLMERNPIRPGQDLHIASLEDIKAQIRKNTDLIESAGEETPQAKFLEDQNAALHNETINRVPEYSPAQLSRMSYTELEQLSTQVTNAIDSSEVIGRDMATNSLLKYLGDIEKSIEPKTNIQQQEIGLGITARTNQNAIPRLREEYLNSVAKLDYIDRTIQDYKYQLQHGDAINTPRVIGDADQLLTGLDSLQKARGVAANEVRARRIALGNTSYEAKGNQFNPFSFTDPTKFIPGLNPVTRTALRAGAPAIGAFITTNGDLEDRLKAALAAGGMGALRGNVAGLGDLAKYIVKNTPIENYKIGQTVYDATDPKNPKVGTVIGIDKTTGEIATTNLGKTNPARQFDTLINHSDKQKNAVEIAAAAKVVNVTPAPNDVTAAKTEAVDILDAARQQVTPGKISQVVNKTPGLGWVEPAARSAPGTPERSVIESGTAAENMKNVQLPRMVQHGKDLRTILQDTFGYDLLTGAQHAQRALAQVAPVAAGTAIGGALTLATGKQEFLEAGILAGLVGTGVISGLQTAGRMRPTPWMDIPFSPSVTSEQMKVIKGAKYANTPDGRMALILDNPELFNLTPEQSKARDAYYAKNLDVLRETNAWRSAAGLPLIPENLNRVFFHWFDGKSLEKADLLKEGGGAAIDVNTPGFGKRLSLERSRDLGDTLFDVWKKHPELKLASGMNGLIANDLSQHTKIRANATMVMGLKRDGNAMFVRNADEMRAAGLTPKDIRAYQKQISEMRKPVSQGGGGWGDIPGVERHIFKPEIISAVKDVMQGENRYQGGLFNALDQTQMAIRTAMFTGDLSAWSMQGVMLGVNDWATTIRHMPQLAMASFKGDSYFKDWITNPENRAMYENAAKAGMIPGREFGGAELHAGGKIGVANAPGFKHLEGNGFGAFLPIFRTYMHNSISNQETFLRALKLDKVPLSSYVLEAFKNTPVALGVLAASQGTIDTPLPDSIDGLIAAALGLTASYGISRGINRIGEYHLPLDKKTLQQIEIDAAKHVNRTSGSLNRPQAGISTKQSQVERALFFRSPALTRNAVLLATKALTDAGPEGRLARVYLGQTLMLVGAGAVAAKYFATGEMDSLDPTDPESVFNPPNLLKVNTGKAGSFAPSNSVMRLISAFAYQDKPPDQKGSFSVEDLVPFRGNNRVDRGLAKWASGRTSDITAPVWDLALNTFNQTDIEKQQAANAGDQSLLGRIAGKDVGGIGRSVSRYLSPLAVQQAIKTGLVNDTALGSHLPDTGIPAYNHISEKLLGLTVPFIGANQNPETLGAEAIRITDEAIKHLVSVNAISPKAFDNQTQVIDGYKSLDQEQKTIVKSYLEKQGIKKEVTDAIDKQIADLGRSKQNITKFIDERTRLNDTYNAQIKAISDQWEKDHNGVAFRASLKAIESERRAKLDQTEATLGQLPSQAVGYQNETVLQRLGKDELPRDKAVSDWYGLFNQATDVNTKQLDFDKLERLQSGYLSSLAPDTRKYVEDRVLTYKTGKLDKQAEIPALAEYNKAKEITKPYFEMRDQVFNEAKQGSPTLSKFENSNEFMKAVNEYAAQAGLQPNDALAFLTKHDPDIRYFNRTLAKQERVMRIDNQQLDATLANWYGRAPVNRNNKGLIKDIKYEAWDIPFGQ